MTRHASSTPSISMPLRVTGLIWIFFGGLTVAQALYLLIAFAALPGSMASLAFYLGITFVVSLVLSLFGAFFVRDGIRVLRGTATRLREIGIGSVVYGLFVVLSGVGEVAPSGIPTTGDGLSVALEAIFIGSGVALIGAGVMAVCYRERYEAWREPK